MNAKSIMSRGYRKISQKRLDASDQTSIFEIQEEDLARLASNIGIGIVLCDTYRLEKRLSQDATGETYLATDKHANENVIIYFPPTEMRKNKKTAKPVRRAAKHIMALEHPRIVPIYAVK